MKIIHYFASGNQAHWLEEIQKSDWSAGQFLCRLLTEGRFHAALGESSELLLLTEGEALLAFCTYAQRDEIPDEALTPWIGFVYTFPSYRGKRRAGKLLEYAYRRAKAEGYSCVYISTGEVGLYEKYGCVFWKTMKDLHEHDSRIYRLEIRDQDYSAILGKRVSGTIDRPLGSSHPRHPEMVYPVNYGYVDGVIGGDGAEQDVYVLGTDQPLQTFTGTVVAVLHRLNDCEDKWIVSLDGRKYSETEIENAVRFQEQYFMGELYS